MITETREVKLICPNCSKEAFSKTENPIKVCSICNLNIHEDELKDFNLQKIRKDLINSILGK